MKRGFTLIELLAVIVILAIILAIAIPSVSNIITSSRLNSFSASSKMLKEATRTYINANNITVADGTTSEILYSNINSAGYISKIVDPINNNECIHSKVYVTNTGGAYTYKGALVCDNYMDIDTYNLVKNGDFSDGTTGWTVGAATLSVANNVLSITGSGTAYIASARPTIIGATNLVTGHKYYIRLKTRVTDNSCSQIKLWLGNDVLAPPIINSPLANQWYVISRIATAISDNIYLSTFEYQYADKATANGKIAEIDGINGVYTFDLTAIYGAGNEPTVAQIDNIIDNMGK